MKKRGGVEEDMYTLYVHEVTNNETCIVDFYPIVQLVELFKLDMTSHKFY